MKVEIGKKIRANERNEGRFKRAFQGLKIVVAIDLDWAPIDAFDAERSVRRTINGTCFCVHLSPNSMYLEDAVLCGPSLS